MLVNRYGQLQQAYQIGVGKFPNGNYGLMILTETGVESLLICESDTDMEVLMQMMEHLQIITRPTIPGSILKAFEEGNAIAEEP